MPPQTPTKILFLTANPSKTLPLKLDEESTFEELARVIDDLVSLHG